MDKLFAFSNAYHIHPIDNVELIEDGCTPADIGDSLLPDLDASDRIKKGERRYHQRFQLDENAYALIRSPSTLPLKIDGKSMGCIACAVFNAKPAKLGVVGNISMGGLTFQHIESKIQLNNAFVLDILLAECGLYLADLPFKIISDLEIPEDIAGDPFSMRQIRLQFLKLSVDHQAKLKALILNHGAEIGDLNVNE
jgi:hypothetical protein